MPRPSPRSLAVFWQEGGKLLRDGAQGAQRESILGGGTVPATHFDAARVATQPMPGRRAFSVRAIAALVVLAIVAAVGMSALVTPAPAVPPQG